METRTRILVFDLGNTLIHERGPWDGLFRRADRALWDVLHNAGVTLEPGELYGDVQNLFELYYGRYRGDLNEPTTAVVLDGLLRSRGFQLSGETLREAMRATFGVTQTNWIPEEDAIPTLEHLKIRGFRLGLISNASDDDNTQALIDKGRLRPFFEYIVSSAAFGKRKPHPGIFRSALHYFGAPPGEAMMIGDDYEADVVGAHNVGMRTVWITRRVEWPDRPPSEVGASAVVSALSEIPALLAGP